MRTVRHNNLALGPAVKTGLYMRDNDGVYWLTIPKTGLITVREFIMGQAGENRHPHDINEVADHVASGGQLIATARDPEERVISAYRWGIWRHELSFGEFLQQIADLTDEERDLHVRSQSWYLKSEDGRIIEPTDWMLTERLTRDLEDRTHYPLRGKLKVRNASTAPRVFPTAIQKNFIRQIYADDFTLYQRVKAARSN